MVDPTTEASATGDALECLVGLVEGDGLRRPAWLNLSVHLFNSVVAWLDLLIGVCVEAGRAVCVMQGGGGGGSGAGAVGDGEQMVDNPARPS